MHDEDTLGLGVYMPPCGPLWTPVGAGSTLSDPMLTYFHDIAFALIEFRANVQKDSPPCFYRKKTSQPFKCRIGDKSFSVRTAPVSDTARKGIRNKAIRNGNFEIEEVQDSPINRLMAHPNDRQNWGKVFYDSERMKAIWGASFLHYEGDNNRLWTVPFSRNQKATYAKNGLDIEQYHLNGVDYKPSQIIALVCTNPANPYRIERPISPLWASCKALYLNDRYFQFVARTFQNGANPTFALKSLKGLTDENHKTVATDLKNNLTGEDDGSIPVYDGTAYELQQFPVPYKDLIGNTLQQDMIRKTVCNCFQVPPGIFNDTATSRAADDAMLVQIYDMLSPMIAERDDALTHFFQAIYEDENIFFATPDPKPVDDDKIRADWQMLLSTGSAKKNEGRKIYAHYGLEQLPEFEETATKPAPQSVALFEDALPDDTTNVASDNSINLLDQSDKLLALQNQYYAGTLPREAALGQLQLVFGLSPENAEKLLPLKETPAPTPQPEPKAKARKTATRDDLEAILVSYFRKQKKHVLDKLTGTEKAVSGKAMEKGECYWWKAKADTNDIDTFFDRKKWNKELFDDAYPCLSLIYQEQVEKNLVKFNVDSDMFGVYSHELKPTIRARILKFCDETNKTTLLQINDAYAKTLEKLEEGTTSGQRLEDLRKSIGEVYTHADDERVYRIANTENAIARTLSSKIAAEKAGVQGMKNLPSPDACQECEDIAKKAGDKFYPLDHQFGGTEYTHYLAPYHPRCRCDYLYQTGGEENE